MHPFSSLWCFQGIEKGCIGNEWVNNTLDFMHLAIDILNIYPQVFIFWWLQNDMKQMLSTLNINYVSPHGSHKTR